MNLAHLFLDTVTVQSQTGSSAYGDPTFGPQRTIKGSVRTVLRKIQTEKGTAVVNASVFMTDQAIAQGDLLWLSGADTTKAAQARRLGIIRSQHTLDGSYTLYEVDL